MGDGRSGERCPLATPAAVEHVGLLASNSDGGGVGGVMTQGGTRLHDSGGEAGHRDHSTPCLCMNQRSSISNSVSQLYHMF
jgi:hypothetical protein